MAQQNNNQTNGAGSIQDTINILIRAGIRSISSPFILNRFATHPLVGNLLMFLLTRSTVAFSVLLLGESGPAQVSAVDMCERIIRTDIKPLLGQKIDTTDMGVISKLYVSKNNNTDLAMMASVIGCLLQFHLSLLKLF